MVSQLHPHISPAEYVALERRAKTKSEYHDGVIVAMAGASRAHHSIAGDTYINLTLRLRGQPCETFTGDMRIYIPARNRYYYPDIVVACGEPQFADAEVDTLLNPSLIAEVLSPSTERFDRAGKFAHYRALPSLVEYLLIAQDEPRVDYYCRQPAGNWFIGEAHNLAATLDLAVGGGCTLRLADLYARVPFPAGAATEQE